jgi:hypothetical protein
MARMNIHEAGLDQLLLGDVPVDERMRGFRRG